MCGVWIALEPTDDENGPLFYYPGSHNLPTFNLADMGIDSKLPIDVKYQLYEKFIEGYTLGKKLVKKALKIDAGTAVIWSANLLHGGMPIIDSKRTRHSQVTHYYFDNCRYYAPLQSDLIEGRVNFIEFANIKTGKYIGRPNLPNVWPPRNLWRKSLESTKILLKEKISSEFKFKLKRMLGRPL